jgi:hypothetical protein
MKTILPLASLLLCACTAPPPPAPEAYVGSWSLSTVGTKVSSLLSCGDLIPVEIAQVVGAKRPDEYVDLDVTVPNLVDRCRLTATVAHNEPYGRPIAPSSACRVAEVDYLVDHGLATIDGDHMSVGVAFTASGDGCDHSLSLTLQRDIP